MSDGNGSKNNEPINGIFNRPQQQQEQQQSAPRPMPITPDMLMVLIGCLLEEHGKPSEELFTAFQALLAERHNHFHVKHAETATAEKMDWRKCSNPICRDMKTILDRSAAPEIIIPFFTFERIKKSKQILLQPLGGRIRLYMADAPKIATMDKRIIV